MTDYTGTDGNDLFDGVDVVNVAFGRGGDDTLKAGPRYNYLDGGTGDDVIEARDGFGILEGGEGADTLTGGASYAVLSSGMVGVPEGMEPGSLYFPDDATRDVLIGGTGRDWLIVGTGDYADGGAGQNGLSLNLWTAASGVHFVVGDLLRDGSMTIAGTTLKNIQTVEGFHGSEFADVFDGRDAPDLEYEMIFSGGGGDDTMLGGAGQQQIYGNDGDDVLDGGAGDDSMDGGDGNDLYYVDSVYDWVDEFYSHDDGVDTVIASVSYRAGTGIEKLVLRGTAVSGIGNDLANTIVGNDLANLINGGGGADTMTGGRGDDTYYVDNVGDVVVERAGDGFDTVESSVDYHLGANVEALTLGYGAVYGTGNAGANLLTGNYDDNQLRGGAGDDTLIGGGGNDILIGGVGNDTASYAQTYASVVVRLDIGHGQNTVGAGIDRLTGIENLVGSTYADKLAGDAGANRIEGGDGNDLLSGGLGDDTLAGGRGDDRLTGGAGFDIASYADAAARVTVNLALTTAQDTQASGVDTLKLIEGVIGSAFNDVLRGDDGANRIEGGAGNDLLQGNGGHDMLLGGLGADRFAYADLADSSVLIAGRDQIGDFSHAEGDRIDLSAIDAVAGGADDAFAFIGSAAFTGVAGQLQVAAIGTDWVVRGDVDGDGGADFAIQVNSATALVAGDFLL